MIKNKQNKKRGFIFTFFNKKGVSSQSERGFSLVEILFVVAIFLLIGGAMSLLSKNIWIYNSFISEGLVNTNAGRQIVKTMATEIRTASAADTGAYTINQAEESSFIFFSDIDDDILKEKIRYFLSGTTLQRGLIKPTGTPLTYNIANETITTIAENVTNTNIFTYYDTNYDGTTAPLSIPVNIPDIRLVKITITIDKDPNRSPNPVTFSTQVSLRNLKDNL